jgi:hypothetical protein
MEIRMKMKAFLRFIIVAFMRPSAPIRRVAAVLGILISIHCLILLPGTAMAATVTATELTTGSSSTDATWWRTPISISPAANTLILAWVSNSVTTTPPGTPTLTGNGLTWVQVATVTWGTIATPLRRTTLFRAMGAAPATDQVTIDFGTGNTQTGCFWSIIQFGNVDTSGTNGSGAVVQAVTGRTDSAPSGTGLTITLAALGDVSNATAGGFSNAINSSTSISAGAGYTASTNRYEANPSHSQRAEWRAAGSTTVNVTQSATSNIGGIGVEIRSAPSATLYRSVGPTVTALASGTSNGLTISGSTAIFDSGLANNIGVGDVIQYDSDDNGSIDALAFIHGRTSSTVYTVKNKAGAAPTATQAKDNNWEIYRAYTTLANWESQNENASITEPTENDVNPSLDLVTADTQLNVACYADGQDSAAVVINGWNTSANHYIRIYTPVSTSEVGTSQRHNGTWSTSGYRLVVSNTCAILVSDNYVKFDGLQVRVSSLSGIDQAGFYFYNMSGAAVGTVSNCIIRGVSGTSYTYHFGIGMYSVGELALYVYNNTIYDFGGTGSSETNCGIVSDDGESGIIAYNNTIQNCYSGLYINSGTILAKNNLIKGSNSTYTYYGTFYAGTDYNATDTTDTPDGVPVGSNRTSQTFSFVNESGDDFHLTSGDAGARNWGTDLSSDSYLPFSTDIDGQPRPSGSAWDIGADEATFQVYYAVGQSTSNDLRTGTPTCQVSGTTITFNTAQTDNRFGVGCKVTYGVSNNVCYISGKTSSTVWSCTNATGGTPTSAVAGTAVNSIRHAFPSLNAAVGGASPGAAGASYLTIANLVTSGYVLNIPCYYDTGADATAVTISAWTTGANNYINIYTPNNISTECNQSQRHSGVWDATKYQVRASVNGHGLIWISDEYVRVTGLQIENTEPKGNRPGGIEIAPGSATSEVRVSHNILRATGTGTGDWWCAAIGQTAVGGVVKAWNNIIYNWGSGFISDYATSSSVTLYNNTIVNPDNVGIEIAGHASGTYRLANNLVQGTPSRVNYYFAAGVLPLTYSATNLSKDATSPDGASFQNKTVTFVGAADFHLASNDGNAMEQGTDLSADANVAFSDDIDGQSRPFGSVWDIGADEYVSPTAVKLISFTATQYSEGILLRWKTGYEVSNLGFHVYREENGQLVRLTPEPVAGSALMAGSRTALTAGHQYHWWDFSLLDTRSSTLATLKYWLKDIDLNGKETMHGPVTPVFSREPLPEKFRPELLSEIGWRLQEKYHHYWKVREIKEKLRQKSSVISHRSSALKVTSNLKAGGRSSNLKPLRLSPQSRYESIPTSSLDTAMQQFLAGRPAVKLFVREEGWYQVSQPELVAAGLSPKTNPRYLQLFVEGQEQPIRVIGDKDGRFDPGDAIEFYGVGLDIPSTDTRVYWLVEGTKPGKRIREFKGYSGSLGPLSSSSYPYTAEKRERRVYFAALRNGDEGNFFGPLVYPAVQVDQILEVRHLDPGASGDALLEVALQGVTTVAHSVKVLVNETEVGEVVFEGQSRGFVSLPFSQSLLEEGENVVTLEARGGEMDASVIETIRLTYWHTYMADDNALRFTAQGGEQLSIRGFGNSGIRVFDITEPGEVIEVTGKVEFQKVGYAISFRVPGTGQRTLLALTEERVKIPEGITSNQPSSWNQVKEGYDLVIISHRDFVESLDPLRKLRESQGLKVALIDIEDLYDEFSFGVKSPKAIKDFLTYVKTKWQKPPRFVLLVGDASYDPRNYLGLGDYDLVPTKLVDTAYFETASDDWFVDFNNDGLPEMAMGRLPVQTAEEAAIIVSKIVGYERSATKREALLVSDKVERSDDFDFERASEEVRGLLPSFLLVRKIYRSQFSSDAQARQELINGINQGPLLVNFIGHGSIGIWNGVLTSEDVEYLTNIGLPFFVGMSCLNGHFQDIYMDSLAEALMKAPQGGAVAVWASSGLTEPDKQAVMNKELIKLLFFNTNGGQSLTLGEATAKAKASVSDQDIRRTWILFGDPTTRLK